MSEWILSVVGVICLGILLEIILPEGQTSKYVKGAFSLLVIFVMAAPLPKLLGAEWALDFDKIFYGVDDAFVSETIAIQTETVEHDVEDFLVLNGYSADVKLELKEGTINIISKIHVSVKLTENELKDKDNHIDNVRRLVSDRLKEPASIIFVELKQDINGGEYGSD